jgi:hypothetical protein
MDHFVHVLYRMHVQQTIANPPPFTHSISLPHGQKLNHHKITLLLSNPQLCKDFETICYHQFLELDVLRGSVHYNPSTWLTIALTIMDEFDDTDTIVFPNGCCSMEQCTINQFYQIIVDQLLIKE